MDTRINPVRYPTLFRYLANLPQGLHSYPHCKTKTHLARVQLDLFPQLKQLHDLPDEIKNAVTGPWPSEGWMSEVHLMIQSALVRDVVCKSDEIYLKTRYDIACQGFRMPVLRTLMSLISPNLLGLASAHRWSHFKQGSKVKMIESESTWAKLALTHEPNLYLPCMLDGFGKVFEAALTCARASEIRCSNQSPTPTETIYTLSWKAKHT